MAVLLRFVCVLMVACVAAASLGLVPSVAAQGAAVEWTQSGDIIAGGDKDRAGASVSLSSDGSRVAVGYPSSDTPGEVRVFERRGDAWVLLGAVIAGVAAGDRFGESVSLSADGSRVAIGAYLHDAPGENAGEVRVFDLNPAGTAWVQVGGDLNGVRESDEFGTSVSLSADGSRVAVGAPNYDLVTGDASASAPTPNNRYGQVRVFDLNPAGTAWSQTGGGIDGEDLGQSVGTSVALSDDGSQLVVGAGVPQHRDPYGVRVFVLDAGTGWTQRGASIQAEDGINIEGQIVAVSGDGLRIAVGTRGTGTDKGQVQIFGWSGSPSAWTLIGTAISGDHQGDKFGSSVSLSRDGSLVAVGARNHSSPNVGQVKVLEQNGAEWTVVGQSLVGDDANKRGLGHSVALSDDGVFVAAGAVRGNSNDVRGAVHVFGRVTALRFTSTASYIVADEETVVGTVLATNADKDPVTYSLGSGADGEKFTIDAASGELTFVAAPDFENPTDAGTNNVYEVVVEATGGGESATQSITVTVADTDEAPAFTSDDVHEIAENETVVTMVVATDPDEGDTVSYTVTKGRDKDLFTIDSDSGELTFVTAPDFETPTDHDTDNEYKVKITAAAGGKSVVQRIVVTVTNVDEAPAFASPTAAHEIAENETDVTTVVATDPDEGDDVSYAIPDGADGGADGARFAIGATSGELTFVAAPDFEAPTDADTDNVYDVVVKATAGGQSVSQSIAVTVTNENDNLPVFTSPGAFSVPENVTAVATLAASDADGDVVVYTLSGGADRARFAIGATSGDLTFVAAPDFEAPTDADTDNVYDVVVKATAGGQSVSQSITVTVININDNRPVFTSAGAFSVPENVAAVATLAASDADGDVVVYTLSGGADRARFVIDATSGELTFVAAPDFEAPTDAGSNNVYDVVVKATAGGQSVIQSITVTVTDASDVVPSCKEGANFKHGFVDVAGKTEANSAIGCLKAIGVTTGTTKTTYSPQDLVTREQAAAFLARMYRVATGKQCKSANHGFSDVSRSSYAYVDVGCLKAIGVTNGTSATTYSPQDLVTREQAAAFLARMYRVATGKQCKSANHGFSDVSRSSYAYVDVGCLKAIGVTNGTSATTYSPQDLVTREQMALFLASLYRAMV